MFTNQCVVDVQVNGLRRLLSFRRAFRKVTGIMMMTTIIVVARISESMGFGVKHAGDQLTKSSADRFILLTPKF